MHPMIRGEDWGREVDEPVQGRLPGDCSVGNTKAQGTLAPVLTISACEKSWLEESTIVVGKHQGKN